MQTNDDSRSVEQLRNDSLKGGCQHWEAAHSFLRGVQMPVVTDDLVGAHWTDGDEKEVAQEGTFKKKTASVRQIFDVQPKVCCSDDNISYWKTQPQTRLASCFLGIMTWMMLPCSLWSEPVIRLSFFLCLVRDQSGFVCHEVMRSFMTNNYVMN